ncbi:zinc finger homeobox protein 3-like [Erinaceus europaeus]|uniref:Zinc finger homeobox protein 3-like n=1 Tax=Erinaceus europaeus TaxID=9365 RepID=A0ABM3X109_ERIEU|nr:zinc finger homeobox protein 3-like [Erinaceus europaeus]
MAAFSSPQGVLPMQQSTLKQKRRERTFFTDEQLQELRDYFEHNRYPRFCEQEALAQKLNLKEDIVRVWFKNQRAKLLRAKSKAPGPAQGLAVHHPITTNPAVLQSPVAPTTDNPSAECSAPAAWVKIQKATPIAPAPPCMGQTKTQRKRTFFTQQQLQGLKSSFQHNQHPGYGEILALAQKLQLKEDRISVWFSNQRARAKDKSTTQPQGLQDTHVYVPAMTPTDGRPLRQTAAVPQSPGCQLSDAPMVSLDPAPACGSRAIPSTPDPAGPTSTECLEPNSGSTPFWGPENTVDPSPSPSTAYPVDPSDLRLLPPDNQLLYKEIDDQLEYYDLDSRLPSSVENPDIADERASCPQEADTLGLGDVQSPYAHGLCWPFTPALAPSPVEPAFSAAPMACGLTLLIPVASCSTQEPSLSMQGQAFGAPSQGAQAYPTPECKEEDTPRPLLPLIPLVFPELLPDIQDEHIFDYFWEQK